MASLVIPPGTFLAVAIIEVWMDLFHLERDDLVLHLGIELAIYALVGPVVIWSVLRWIERELAEKETVQLRLRSQERRLMEIRDEVTGQIASDLHDRLGPQLYAIALKAEFSKKRLRSHPDEAERELTVMNTALRESLEEVRRAVYALRPVELERRGLLETLRQLASTSEELSQALVEVTITGEEPRFPSELEVGIFYIVQEALHNVRRYARASRVCIDFDVGPQALELRVRDDGVGFDATVTPEGVGLRHMRERAEALGGTFSVRAAVGKGTEIAVSVPGVNHEREA